MKTKFDWAIILVPLGLLGLVVVLIGAAVSSSNQYQKDQNKKYEECKGYVFESNTRYTVDVPAGIEWCFKNFHPELK